MEGRKGRGEKEERGIGGRERIFPYSILARQKKEGETRAGREGKEQWDREKE